MEPSPVPARLRDAAVVVPVSGLLLLMPPILQLFAVPVTVLGIPLVVLFLFGVWAVLVLLTWWFARRLAGRGESPPDA